MMKVYFADLHIHTVLSPCGDLEMSPLNIVNKAKEQKLDIIGITDHNSTKHCLLIEKLGSEVGIFVLLGAEITTKEEVHCLAFFENSILLNEFQQYLSESLPFVRNNPSYFGYQVVVDKDENIVEEVQSLLIIAINQSVNEVKDKVRQLNGIFILAHVDKPRNSILSQLGFLPDNLFPDAIEVNGTIEINKFLNEHPEFGTYTILENSDAHMLNQIGSKKNRFKLNHVSFKEIKMALHKENERGVLV